MEIQSYLFEKDKGRRKERTKEWFEKHYSPAEEHVYAVLPFTITARYEMVSFLVEAVKGLVEVHLCSAS